MAKCQTCSAPLPANSQYCEYCGVRNDIDIRGKLDYQVVDRQSERLCPACQIAMQRIALDLEPPLEIERCPSCYGLFFDPGEVEALLESAVSPVFNVNLEWLGNINRDRYRRDDTVKYLKCPDCQILMNRVVYGHRSGVVIDRCKKHGVWLDGGEISHLLEWKKAGGQILQQQKQSEQAQRQPQNKAPRAELDTLLQHYDRHSEENELLESVAGLIFKLFA